MKNVLCPRGKVRDTNSRAPCDVMRSDVLFSVQVMFVDSIMLTLLYYLGQLLIFINSPTTQRLLLILKTGGRSGE